MHTVRKPNHTIRIHDTHLEIFDESTQSVKFRLDYANSSSSIAAYELAEGICQGLNESGKETP